ncbi:hypothetical protein [Winogradskyella algicola]|uniref:hypothetical protein n=1 Tax=Winogradskyella algicola TaxID=2575815 RepID=UPI00110948FA|nr:hypothetical protein [Winogradskyella algicola]
MPKSEDINPFVLAKKILAIKLHKNSRLKSKDKEEEHSFSNSYIVDRDYSTKLYRSRDTEDIIFALSNSGQKLFLYLLLHIQRKSDSIQLIPSKIEKKTGMKETSFNKARSELKKKGIIKKKTGRDRMYWVNPHIFFNGNRPKFYSNHILMATDNSTNMKKMIQD